jgi:hypothetical protein
LRNSTAPSEPNTRRRRQLRRGSEKETNDIIVDYFVMATGLVLVSVVVSEMPHRT